MSKGGTGKAKPTPAAPRKRKGIDGEQVDMPGTDQDRDDVLERQGKRWQDLKAERTVLSQQIADCEQKIAARFAEFAESDPRRHAYRIRSGHILRPNPQTKVKVTRPPSRETKAKAKADAEGSE